MLPLAYVIVDLSEFGQWIKGGGGWQGKTVGNTDFAHICHTFAQIG